MASPAATSAPPPLSGAREPGRCPSARVPRPLPWMLLFLVVGMAQGCRALERDASEEAELQTLDRVLAEKQELLSNRAERERAQALLREELAAFQPPTDAELTAFAGPGAQLDGRRPGLDSELLTVSAPGSTRDAIAFVHAALERSQAVGVTQLALQPGRWSVTLAVARLPGPVTKGKAAPAPATDAFCWRTCRERRARIATTKASIAALESTLGALNAINLDKKALAHAKRVKQQLAGAEALPWFDRLAEADWLAAEAEVLIRVDPRTHTQTVLLTGPPELAPRCAATFAPLGPCTYDARAARLSVAMAL